MVMAPSCRSVVNLFAYPFIFGIKLSLTGNANGARTYSLVAS
jgi:hypothetical protein